MKRFRIALLGVCALSACIGLSCHPAADAVRARRPADSKPAAITYAPIRTGEYKIDPAHSTVGFSIRHLEINWVTGRFRDFTGTIRYDESDITKSSVEWTAKMESIDTGVAARDNHLRNADFFDIAKFPEMMFKSTKIEKRGKSGYQLFGDFTMKGVTKQISFPFTITGTVTDARGNTRYGIEAHTKLNRRDYGVNYGGPLPTGGLDIGNEVTINLHLEALKPAPAKPAAP